MTSYKITVDISGPVFDGVADAVAQDVVEATAKSLADVGSRDIKRAALLMNKSGRGGTGRAAAGVLTFDHGPTQVIYGEMITGQVWWPWLEGISKRNASTPFKGYFQFAKTATILDAHAREELQRQLDERIGEMGGEP